MKPAIIVAIASASSVVSGFIIFNRVVEITLPRLQKAFHRHSSPQWRLVQINEHSSPEWMTEEDKLRLLQNGIKFMDVTDHQSLGVINSKEAIFKENKLPTKPSHNNHVNQVIANLTTEYMQVNLEALTSFHNRYYKSEYGAASAKWLFEQITQTVKNNDAQDYVSVRKFKHEWGQHSVIARISPKSYKGNQLVIIGAHQDSANMFLPSILAAPGADDDGSGTVTIWEAFRALLVNKFQPSIPIEFHWYSAEEGGLLGSQAIAETYEQNGVKVKAMIQMDMTGYVGRNEPVIGIVTDYVDPSLTKFVSSLVDTYSLLNPVDTQCGYACSDHASWRKAGYPSAFTIESTFSASNKAIHTTNDKIDLLSFDHMLEFAKVATGFAIELAA